MAVYDLFGNDLTRKEYSGYTNQECIDAFIAYMNEQCTRFGMTGTTYVNSSGLTTNNVATPQDELKLATVVASNPVAMDIWGTSDKNFSIKGTNERTINVVNNVIELYATPLSNAGYKFLGGKGGSLWYEGYYAHRASVIIEEIEEKIVATAVMVTGTQAYNNIAKSVKELCDMMKASLNGETPTEGEYLTAMLNAGGGYAACVIPDCPGAYVNQEKPSELLQRSYSLSHNPTASRTPASTTKIMTMLCALDYVPDLHDFMTVKEFDLKSGSGSAFYDGDILTYSDALHIMMMESSNTLAAAIGRNVGARILYSQEAN